MSSLTPILNPFPASLTLQVPPASPVYNRAFVGAPQPLSALPPSAPKQSFAPLLKALGMLGAGLLLHRLPAGKSTFQIISSDWKDWARLALGVSSVDQLNKFLGWKPKPWQLALQTVTAITALTNGLRNPQGWKNFPLLAAFVPLLVQGTHHLNEFAERQVKENQLNLPEWLPKLVISATSTVLGVVALRGVMQSTPYRRATGQEPATGHSGQVIGAEAVVCARCSGQHLICMSELGEMLGSLGGWIKGERKETL